MEHSVTCSQCKAPIVSEQIFCNQCGFPENGDEQAKARFHYSVKLKKDALQEANKKLKQVNILLYILAGINLIAGLFWLSSDTQLAEGIGSLITAIIFVGCALWVKRNPLMGVLAAFIFWFSLQLLSGILEPETIFQGLILKAIIIAFFVKGIQSARDAKEFKEKLKNSVPNS